MSRSGRAGGPRWRRFLPVGLGGLACAMCCTVPILVLTGVVSGGAVAAAVDGWLDAAATVLIAVAALLVAVPLWRRRRAARAGGCSCGCGASAACGRPADEQALNLPQVRSGS